MDLLSQIFAGVVVAVLGSVLTAVILHRLRLGNDGGPSAVPPTPVAPAQTSTDESDPASESEESAPDSPAQGRGRREETLRVLFRHGIVAPGSIIEPMPQALPRGDNAMPAEFFRVRIGNPPGREVIWPHDNQSYSLTGLSNELAEKHGLYWFRPKTFELWRLVGQAESLWDVADRLVRSEVSKPE